MRGIPGTNSNMSLFSRQWRNLSIGAIGLCSMIAFEAIGVAAGMPAVAADLDGVSLYALAFAGTLAGSVFAMVWAGDDCDRHGPFRSMAIGMLLFAVGLLIAGFAESMNMLVLGRVIQGLGAGALGVALYVSVARAVPPELHPRLFAMFSSAWVIPAIVGPAISGWIVEQLGWRWLFLGVLLLLLPTAALILPPLRTDSASDSHAPARRSWRSLPWAMLASSGSVALALSAYGGRWTFFVVAASLIALLMSARRLLPAGTLKLERGLPAVVALRGFNSAAFFLCEAFVPLWLHQQRGWSITAAGLALTVGALSWSIGSHWQSRMRRDAHRQVWLGRGCLLLSTGIAVCALTVLGMLPEWTMLIGWSTAGLGVGLSLPMLGVLMLKLAPCEQQGTWSSALQLSTALCTSSALALGGLLFSLLHERIATAAFTSVFAFASAISILASMFARRTDTNPPKLLSGQPENRPRLASAQRTLLKD
jgi:MFS family permease